jgi:hypothetical protein
VVACVVVILTTSRETTVLEKSQTLLLDELILT